MKTCVRVLAIGIAAISWYMPVSALQVRVSDAPIRTVLEGLAKSGNLNLIIDDSVQGNMTLHLDHVTPAQAVEAIAASQNLFYDTGSPIGIITAGRNEEKGKQYYTWQLKNTTPEAVIRAIQAVVPAAAVKSYADSNTVVVGSTKREAQLVNKLVQQLDKKTAQVDVAVRIVSLDRKALHKRGIEWDWQPFGSGAQTVFSWLGQIQALSEQGKAEILASPHIMASNGKAAQILIGDRVPVLKEHLANGEKTASISYEEAGVKLNYTPYIHQDGSVTASIEAEVSTPVWVPEMKAYRISTRRAKTIVRMKPDKTLVIGGLIGKEEMEHFRKVPLLGDIPLVGKLFQSRYKTAKETEVVIMLQARPVQDEEQNTVATELFPSIEDEKCLLAGNGVDR